MYKGQWKDGNMHGFGKYVWKDSKMYDGQYVDDKKHGYGTYTWPDGRKYMGYWKDGKQHGLAEYHVRNASSSNNLHAPVTQIRYGLWDGGARMKWFSVKQEVDI